MDRMGVPTHLTEIPNAPAATALATKMQKYTNVRPVNDVIWPHVAVALSLSMIVGVGRRGWAGRGVGVGQGPARGREV